MATAKRTGGWRNRRWPKLLLGALLLVAIALWFYRTPLNAQATVATAYAARVGCACIYIGGRAAGDCEKDFESGMEFVFLSDDPERKSVSATIPLISSDTATYSEASGCVLQPWDD